jgi:hypothetical protein
MNWKSKRLKKKIFTNAKVWKNYTEAGEKGELFNLFKEN